MGLLDRLLGRPERTERRTGPHGNPPQADRDDAAIARYRYLLRTAPPEAIEQAHAEAFTQLTPDQRRQVLASLSGEVPGADWARSYDPHSLARVATRAELRHPGTLERSFGRGFPVGTRGPGGGLGMGGVLAGSLLASVAGAFAGTAVAEALLPDDFDVMDAGDLGGDHGGDFGADA